MIQLPQPINAEESTYVVNRFIELIVNHIQIFLSMTTDQQLTILLSDGLPYLLSVITLWMNLLAGNLKPYAWLVGLINQAIWLFWIIFTQKYGFLPMNIGLWYVYFRNHQKWYKKIK